MKKKRPLTYAIEFVRFSAGFVAVVACALIALHFVNAAQ